MPLPPDCLHAFLDNGVAGLGQMVSANAGKSIFWSLHNAARNMKPVFFNILNEVDPYCLSYFTGSYGISH